MRIGWILAIGFLVVLSVAALPDVQAQTAKRLFLPSIQRDPTSTPTRTPTPTPTPVQDLKIEYRAYVQDRGWGAWVGGSNDSGTAGTTGEARQIEAFEMRIVSGPPGVIIRYEAHATDLGWMGNVANGQTAGTTGQNRAIQAIRIWLENAPPNTYVSYEPYVADWGWIGWVRDSWDAGTTGQNRRIEAFHAYIKKGSPEAAQIKIAYNANPRGRGYTGWFRAGEQAGTTGESLALNTFKAVLYNKPQSMAIEYRCNVQDNDWQPFTQGDCGFFNDNKDLYAFEMRLINAYPGTVLSYDGHIANRGWLHYATDSTTDRNPIIGDPSQKFRVEAIRIGVGSAQP